MTSMRLTTILAILIGLSAPASGYGKTTPDVTILVHDQGQATSAAIELADIAQITCSDSKLAERLRTVAIGVAPLPDCTRTLTRGDVQLKLRQSGFDPCTMSIAGAETIHVTSAAPSVVVAPTAATSTANPAAIAPAPVKQPLVVKPGASISLVFSDGTVTIECAGSAVTGGAIGDAITVRPSFSLKLLTGTILDAHTVQLRD